MKNVFWFILALFLSSCSMSKSMPRERPNGYYKSEKECAVKIYIKTINAPLGAYTIKLFYDSSFLHIARIESGSSEEFTGTPIFDETSFTKGKTVITGFTVKREWQARQSSRYHIATVFFNPIQPGRVPVTVEVTTLADLQANRIDGDIILSQDIIDTREFLER